MRRPRRKLATIPAPLLIAAAVAVSLGGDVAGASAFTGTIPASRGQIIARVTDSRESAENWLACLHDVARRLQGQQVAVMDRPTLRFQTPAPEPLALAAPAARQAPPSSRVIRQHLNLPPPIASTHL